MREKAGEVNIMKGYVTNDEALGPRKTMESFNRFGKSADRPYVS